MCKIDDTDKSTHIEDNGGQPKKARHFHHTRLVFVVDDSHCIRQVAKTREDENADDAGNDLVEGMSG